MKKFLLLVALVATSTLGAFAQIGAGEKSVVIQAGVKSNPARFAIGAEGRYNIIDNVRIAPNVYFVFPKDKTTGLDVDLNAHYVFDLGMVTPDLSFYPLAGLSMQNGHQSSRTLTTLGGTSYKLDSRSFTDWGFNLGAGFDYGINSNSFLNLELKYTFSNADCFNAFVGYGFKF